MIIVIIFVIYTYVGGDSAPPPAQSTANWSSW
jgi:hypothetical protein